MEITAMIASRPRVNGAATNTGNSRATTYAPAATIVAAWISALTGAGPAIASGSQLCNGNCADLPTTPASSSRVAANNVPDDIDGKAASTSVIRNEPAATPSTKIPN